MLKLAGEMNLRKTYWHSNLDYPNWHYPYNCRKNIPSVVTCLFTSQDREDYPDISEIGFLGSVFNCRFSDAKTCFESIRREREVGWTTDFYAFLDVTVPGSSHISRTWIGNATSIVIHDRYVIGFNNFLDAARYYIPGKTTMMFGTQKPGKFEMLKIWTYLRKSLRVANFEQFRIMYEACTRKDRFFMTKPLGDPKLLDTSFYDLDYSHGYV